MTREEIKQEAQEQVNYCTPLYQESFIQGYVAGAEPREKRITELEQQIEKMRCCGNCKYGFCSWSSESIDKNGRRTCHAWNKEKQAYCDIGNGNDAKYQCWEIEEND